MFNDGNWDQWLPAKTDHLHGAHEALGPSVSLRARRCLHRVRRLPLLDARPDRHQPLLHVDRLGRQRRRHGGPVIANDELGYGWQTYPERLQKAGISWKIYQDIGDGLDKAGRWGWHPGSVHRQLRRQLAAVLPQLPERDAGQPAVPEGPHRHRRQPQRRLLRHPHRRCQARPAAEGVVDRRARGVHRASGVARRLRRLVHRRRAQRADQRPRGVVKDGAADHLRRERRLLRPRRRALPQRRRARRAVDRAAWTTNCSTATPAHPAARTESSDPTASAYASRC